MPPPSAEEEDQKDQKEEEEEEEEEDGAAMAEKALAEVEAAENSLSSSSPDGRRGVASGTRG